MAKQTAISLYTGAGGLDIGLHRAGFETRVCVEMDADSCRTLRANRLSRAILERDITTVPTEEILAEGGLKRGQVALLAGGPPCQPFSKSGNWRNPHGAKRGLKDPRAVTLHEYLRVLDEAQPAAFLMENVYGLAYKVNGNALDLVLDRVQELGYTPAYAVLNAADYGVPQIRKRLFIVGFRDGQQLEFPTPTYADPDIEPDLFSRGLLPFVTAGEAIGDLDDGQASDEESVGGKWGHLLPEVPPGDNYLFFTEKRGHPQPLFGWRKRYWSFLLKLSPDKPAWTIQAQPGPYVGPFHWRNRRLRTSELKRLQTFPDDYEITGRRNAVQRQLGNAVPSRIGEVLGRAIIEQLGPSRVARKSEARRSTHGRPQAVIASARRS